MAKVFVVRECAQCGSSFTESTFMSKGNLLNRGADLEKIKNNPEEHPIHITLESCQGHANLKEA